MGENENRPRPGLFSRIWAWILSWFTRRPLATPVNGCGARIKNIIFCHFRGLLGFLVPLCVLSWQGSRERADITVRCIWMLMFWFFLLQPVAIPATSFLPIFLFPMTGIMSSEETCQCYINENIILFILTGMLLLCLNNSGYDRRLALWFLCSGDVCQFGGKVLIFKCCTAGFFLSMISSRLMAASTIIQYISKPLMDLQAATSRASEPNFDSIRHVIVSASASSCAIGSIAIMHAAPATIAFRTLFHESGSYPDIFNYLQYSAFAFPTAAVLNLVNIGYHMLILNCAAGKSISIASKGKIRTDLLKFKSEIPKKMSLHEKLTVFFVIFYLIIFFTRWCKWLKMGWAGFTRYLVGGNENIPACLDATTAAIFVVVLHTLPKGTSFWNVIMESKKSKLPPLKRESGILWWRFVDKNLNYAYMFLIGSGVALTKAISSSGYSLAIAQFTGQIITKRPYNVGLFLICLITVILANIMPGVAGLVVFLPWVITVCNTPYTPGIITKLQETTPNYNNMLGILSVGSIYSHYYYVCALAVGLCSSFGFMFPFMYTPAYFAHHTGKVPKMKMAKYGFVAAFLCCCVTWASLVILAPMIWGTVSTVTPPQQALGPMISLPTTPDLINIFGPTTTGVSDDIGGLNSTG